MKEFNAIINQWDLNNIYTSRHQKTKYTFSSSVYGAYTKIYHIRGQKHVKKFKRIEIIQTVSSDHSEIKLDIDSRTITGKPPNTWKLSCF